VARVTWKKGSIVNLRLKANLHAIGLMHEDPYLFIFDIHNRDGNWANVDLDAAPVLFCVLVGRDCLKRLQMEKLKSGIKLTRMPDFPKLWLKPKQCFDGVFPWYNARLVEVDPGMGTYRARVVNDDVTAQDTEVIAAHELTNMWGADDLSERLVAYFESGEKVDKLKAKIFRLVTASNP
jgi:hypothetical protein